MKVKSKNYFSFTDFFAKIKPLLTHVCKTPPLRSHYSRWMPGQKLAIVRKSDRLKSEGDFEGDRQLEEWSPADRFSDSTFYSRLVFSVNCFLTHILSHILEKSGQKSSRLYLSYFQSNAKKKKCTYVHNQNSVLR